MRDPDIDLTSGSRKRALWIAGAVGLVTAAVVVLIFRRASETPKEPPVSAAKLAELEADQAVAKYGKHALEIRDQRERLAKTPCDRETALELGDRLNQMRDYDGALALVEHFSQACGEWPRLLWVATYAHQQKSEWAQSAAINGKLIADDPTDPDFWWWRGEDRAQLKQDTLAEADFRQSMASRPDKFAAFKLASLLTKTAPCEGAFALQYLSEKRPERVGQWASEKINELHLAAGGCADLAGKGRASLGREPSSPLVKVEATVGGQTGVFIVSEQIAYVTVARELAQKAGIQEGSDEVSLYLGGDIVPARVAQVERVSLGPASARRVAVAVVDKLPDGVDGMIGLSFLWRFTTDTSGNKLTLAARSR